MAAVNGTLIVLHVVQVQFGFQEVGISRFTDYLLDILLHLIEQVRPENVVSIFETHFDHLPNILRDRQFALFQKPVNGTDDLPNHFVIDLLLETLTSEIKIQSIAMNAAFLLDILLEQLDAIAVLEQVGQRLGPFEARWRR